MAEHKRRPVPFSQVVQPVAEEPLEMRWRLDFADWLEAHGAAPRAKWIRECCGVWDAVQPLAMGWGTAAGPIVSAPWGIVDLSNSAVYRWQELRPDYWREIDGATQTAYFGRIVFTALEDRAVEALGQADWLPQAYLDGWLESIDLRSATASQLRRLATWPETHRRLPLCIDTTYFSSAEIDEGLMRETLRLEGLQGIAFSETELRYACVKRFAEFAPNLRYLRLYPKAVGTSLRLLEQLAHLEKLRSLLVGGSLPDDSSIALLTKVPKLQTLRLYGRKPLSDDGVMQLAALESLCVLAVDLPQVSRAGIEALRAARPDLTIRVEGDLRNRLGPV